MDYLRLQLHHLDTSCCLDSFNAEPAIAWTIVCCVRTLILQNDTAMVVVASSVNSRMPFVSETVLRHQCLLVC